MEEQIYIVRGNEIIEVAKVKDGKVLEKKNFDRDNFETIVDYLLSLGATIKEVNEQKKLIGNLVMYGTPLKIIKDGERYHILCKRLDYDFFYSSGFIENSPKNDSLIFKRFGDINIVSILKTEKYLTKKSFTDKELRNLENDAKFFINNFSPKTFDNGVSLQVAHVGSRLINDLRILYLNGKKNEIKTLLKSDCVKRNIESKDNDTKIGFGSFLLSFEKTVLEHGEDLTVFLPKNTNDLFECYKTEIEDGFSRAGIYWVANDKLYLHYRNIAKFALETNKSLITNDKVDCGYSHIKEWEKHKKEYPDKDFASFPRGRVLFDLKTDEHVIFVDDCIKEDSIQELIEKMGIKKYRIEKDEHYSCDNCVEKKDIWND